MFLKHVSILSVRASQNASGKGVSLFFVVVLMVFQLPSAVLDFSQPDFIPAA